MTFLSRFTLIDLEVMEVFGVRIPLNLFVSERGGREEIWRIRRMKIERRGVWPVSLTLFDTLFLPLLHKSKRFGGVWIMPKNDKTELLL